MATLDQHPPQVPSYELVVYQLGELRSITEAGFKNLDGRIERVEEKVGGVRDRVTVLEVKAAEASRFTLPGSDAVKLIGFVVAILVAAIGGDAAGVVNFG